MPSFEKKLAPSALDAEDTLEVPSISEARLKKMQENAPDSTDENEMEASPDTDRRPRSFSERLADASPRLQALESRMGSAFGDHQEKLSDIALELEDESHELEELVAQAHRDNADRETKDALNSHIEKTQKLIGVFDADNPLEAYQTLKAEEAPKTERMPMHETSSEEKEMYDLRQRIINEYGVAPEDMEKGMSLSNRFKNWTSKFTRQGSLLDKYEDLKTGIPMLRVSNKLRETAQDYTEAKKNVREITSAEYLQQSPMHTERERRAEMQREKLEKEWQELMTAPEFDLQTGPAAEALGPKTEQEARVDREVELMDQRGGETTAELVGRIQKHTEKENAERTERRAKHKASPAPEITDPNATRSTLIPIHVDLPEASTEQNPAASRRAFRAKSAEQLKRAKPAEEPSVVIAPELQEEISNQELGKRQAAEAAPLRAERDRDAEALKTEMRAFALNEKATDPKSVIELNTKTDGKFFAEAENLWEEAREAAAGGLSNISDASEFRARSSLRDKSASKRLVEQGRMSAEDLATRYVMARARLKAAEAAGLDDKEIAKLQDTLDKEPASYYLRVHQAKPPTANEDMEAAYLARRNGPLEATPERKASAKEQAAKAGTELAKKGVRTRLNKTAEAALSAEDAPAAEEKAPLTINVPDGEYQLVGNTIPSPAIEEKGPNTIPGVAPQGPQAPRGEKARKTEMRSEPAEKSLDERLAERDARRAKRAEKRTGRDERATNVAEDLNDATILDDEMKTTLKEYATGQRAIDEKGIALVDGYLGKSLSKEEMDAYSSMEQEGKLEDAKEYLNALARARAAQAAGMEGAYTKFLENYANSILDQRIKKQQNAGAPRGRAQNAPRAGKGGRQNPPRPRS